MWLKKSLIKSSAFSKVVLVVMLLLLPVSQLLALPGWLTGEDGDELTFQLRSTIQENEEKIESQKVYIEELETALAALEKGSNEKGEVITSLESSVMKLREQLRISKLNLEQMTEENEKLRADLKMLETQLDELVVASIESGNSDEVLQKHIEQLKANSTELNQQLAQKQSELIKMKTELELLKGYTGLSEDDYDQKMGELVNLKDAYDQKAAEADEYYQDLVEAEANEDKGFGGMFGGGAVFNPTSFTFDASLEMGVEFNGFMVKAGVIYPVGDVLTINFDPSKIRYSAGFQYRF